MKTIIEFIKQIFESKEYIYSDDFLAFYYGDHGIDRKFDRHITNDVVYKTLSKFANVLRENIKNNEIKLNDEFVLINKNVKPYLNIPIKYVGTKNNKYILAIKTIIQKDKFLTSSKTYIIYA